MSMAALEKETISRSTPSNLEGLSEVKSDIKKIDKSMLRRGRVKKIKAWREKNIYQ